MGQSVSQQLGSNALGYGVDPDYLRSQILQQREKQFSAIQNPFQQAAARLGTVLGGGIANVVNDRGFFEVSDPLLTKVTQIQGIYNQVAGQIDPAADPQRFFTELQKAYSDAGMGQQALMAAQEATKAKGSSLDMQLKETQVLEKNPELIAGRIEEALKAGNEPEAMRLANLKTRLDETKGLEVEKTKADIARLKALTNEAKERIESGKYDWKVINNAAGAPIGVQTINKKTGEVEFKEVDPDIAKKFLQFGGDSTTTTPSGEKKDRAPLNSFATNATPNAAAPAARQTTWSGVPVQPKPATPLTPIQERDFAIQRAYPTIPVSSLTEESKAQLAQQLGL